jgi:hypothetical protein
MVMKLEDLFPSLRAGNYQITSPAERHYNCIAWAAGDTQRWWWPERDPDNGYWPEGVEAAVTLSAFVAAFMTLGYAACDQEAVELGLERIALFTESTGIPTHAARQLPSGRWTSKLGALEDIEHDLHDLIGETYGTVAQLMVRRSAAALEPGTQDR